MGKKKTLEEFVEQANLVHNNKYNYDKSIYINNHTQICIICPKHGEFWQTPNSHLNGNGCPACSNVKRMTNEEFIKRVNSIHNFKYKYYNDFSGIHHKIQISCPIHGDFFQLAKRHLEGQGCPMCGKQYSINWNKNNYNHFVEESNKRFNNYSFPYIQNEYENSHSVLTIKCKKCGNTFQKIACDHLTSPFGGCQNCFSDTSYGEKKISKFIKDILPNIEIKYNDRKILNGKELDIYIPSLNIAIEYNGLFWHSGMFRCDKNYHLNKTIECERQGIRLIQIFEDELLHKEDIVFSKIKHILYQSNEKGNKIYGRKCIVKQIDYKLSKDFLEKNHIQGASKATIYIGCYYEDNLVGVMNFIKNSNNKWILNRFATDIDLNCIGVGGKIFHWFISHYCPLEIISFADRRWSTVLHDNFYNLVGFKLDKILPPNYSYFMNGVKNRLHKFNFRKSKLHKKYGLSLSLTENEMTKEIGAYKIWDCGLIKYIWKYGEN